MKWQPDLTPEQLQAVLNTPIQWGSLQPIDEVGLTKKVLWKDQSGKHYIYTPWNKGKVWEKLEGFKIPGVSGHMVEAPARFWTIKDKIYRNRDSILDVGGYEGIWLWIFEAKRKVLVDICQEAVERWAAIHLTEFYVDNGANIGSLFKENEFDIVLLLDVLEHMEKEDGHAALVAAEKIAKYQVIITGPDGWLRYDETTEAYRHTMDLGLPCLEAARHKSAWTSDFFRKRGYEVVIYPGLFAPIGGQDGMTAFYNKW